MKVKQLIARLQKLDPEIPVFVRGYEGGVNDVSHLRAVRVLRNANSDIPYYGKHEVNPQGRTKGIELVGRNR